MPDGKGLLARFPSNPLVQGLRLLPLGGRAEDLLSIKPAVLDEDLRDLRARRHTPRDVYAGDRRFQGFGIDLRASRIGIEGDSDALEQLEIGMKPDQRVDPGCGNPLLVAERTAHEHIARRDVLVRGALGNEERIPATRSEEHTYEIPTRCHLVYR